MPKKKDDTKITIKSGDKEVTTDLEGIKDATKKMKEQTANIESIAPDEPDDFMAMPTLAGALEKVSEKVGTESPEQTRGRIAAASHHFSTRYGKIEEQIDELRKLRADLKESEYRKKTAAENYKAKESDLKEELDELLREIDDFGQTDIFEEMNRMAAIYAELGRMETEEPRLHDLLQEVEIDQAELDALLADTELLGRAREVMEAFGQDIACDPSRKHVIDTAFIESRDYDGDDEKGKSFVGDYGVPVYAD